MKLIVTVDTEEDNWGDFTTGEYSVSNVQYLPAFQEICEQFGICPTYLVSYQVACKDESLKVLQELHAKCKCEIGAHCHPWNTPPLTEKCDEKHSMLSNLEPALQAQKIVALTSLIQNNLSLQPTTFRSGRWGLNDSVAQNLIRLGYTVDTSTTAYTDWSQFCGPDYSKTSSFPYWIHSSKEIDGFSPSTLLEIPASCLYQQRNENVANKIYQSIKNSPLKSFHLIGLCDRLRLVNRVFCSPENSSTTEITKWLNSHLAKSSLPFINYTFHSTTLLPGATPFVTTKSDKQKFLTRLKEFFSYCQAQGIESLTCKSARDIFSSNN